LFDERFTSAFADEIIREAGLKRTQRKQLLDKLAAQILLTHYLESRLSADPDPRALDDNPEPME
jgi:putative Holliday junction resolvase